MGGRLTCQYRGKSLSAPSRKCSWSGPEESHSAIDVYIYALKTAADKAASLAVMTDKYTETCRREDVICGYNGGKGALWDMYDRE